MTIEKLDSDVEIPYDEEVILSGDPARLAEYLLDLVKTLQDLLEKITTVANFNVDLDDGEAIYSKLKNADGNYPLNTWRLIQIDKDWVRQVQLEIGTWTTAGSFEVPI